MSERDYGYLYGEETLRFYGEETLRFHGIRFKNIQEIRMPRPTYKRAISDLVEDIRYLTSNHAPQHIIKPLTDLAKQWIFVEEMKQDDTHND